MTKRICAALLAAVMLILSFCIMQGCDDGGDEGFFGSCADTGSYPVTIGGVRIDERPQRVVCISGKLTDIIIELGYSKYLVGKPYQYSSQAVSGASECGTNDQPSLEIIEKLDADLVIADEKLPDESKDALEELGAIVLKLTTPYDRISFRGAYSCIGAALGGAGKGNDRGLKCAESILIQLDDIERTVSSDPISYVCIFSDSTLTKYVTGDDITSMCIELAGGFNVAVEGREGSYTLNGVARGDPDVILCPSGSQPLVRSKRILNTCTAMKKNQIYDYTAAKFNSCSSQLVEATWELARLLHPTIVTAEMLPKNAVDYFVYTSPVMTVEEYETMLSLQAEAESEETFTFTYED